MNKRREAPSIVVTFGRGGFTNATMIKTNFDFCSSIVELELNETYEDEIKKEYNNYNRIYKPDQFKAFIDYFMKNKKEEEVKMKVLRMVPKSKYEKLQR